jgi:thiosulfate reductase cytochrome b subunit
MLMNARWLISSSELDRVSLQAFQLRYSEPMPFSYLFPPWMALGSHFVVKTAEPHGSFHFLCAFAPLRENLAGSGLEQFD